LPDRRAAVQVRWGERPGLGNSEPIGQPDGALHVVDDVGEADLHGGAGDADGSDDEAHRPLLAGEDMIDRRAHLGLGSVGSGDARRHRLALWQTRGPRGVHRR